MSGAPRADSDVEATPKVSVILPASNEVMLLGSTVTNLVTGLEQRGLSFELLVVENGSTDGTLRLARILAAQLDAVRVLSLERADYGAALATGLREAHGEILATFDVDYYDLAFLDKALALVEGEGADLVLASKRAPGSDDRRPLVRRALTATFSTLVQTALGSQASDVHGMKLLRAATMRPVAAVTESRGSLFDAELVVRAGRLGRAISEVPVSVRELRPPRSSVVRRSVESAVGIVRLRVVLGAGSRRTDERATLHDEARSVIGRLSAGAAAGRSWRRPAPPRRGRAAPK